MCIDYLQRKLLPTLCSLWAASVLVLCPVTLAAEETARDPAVLYADFCSVCHGEKGDGNSRAKAGLVPPPRDFTQPQAAVILTRERMLHSVAEGVAGTAMTAWKSQLNEAEIGSVVDLIRDKFMFSTIAEKTSRGSKIFADFCSVCHGETGSGAMWAVSGLSPPPVNFS